MTVLTNNFERMDLQIGRSKNINQKVAHDSHLRHTNEKDVVCLREF